MMSYRNNEKKGSRRVLQEELTQKKIEKETEYFWSLIERNRRQNKRLPEINSSEEEKKLFGSQGNAGIKFDSYESIPVEKSGPHADSAPPLDSFAALNDVLPDFMIANLQRMKYDVPTPIQKYAIPIALLGHDLMCSAQTGSGKTCAFLFPMITTLDTYINSLDPNIGECRYLSSIDERGVHPLAVVLAPTRELAAQIHLESKKICFGSQLRSLVLYGGSEIRNQLSDLSYGCDIIIATPGRLIDIIDRGIISLSEVKCLILDEADRMLDMGFEPQIREIVQYRDMPVKENRQTLMFSATFKPDIQKLASEFLVDYVWIGVGRVGSTVENIKQNIVLSTPEPSVKLQLTVDAINSTPGRTLIFVQMKRTAAWLSETLRTQFNIRVDDIHSDKSQMQREASLRRFRDGQVRVLVGTDVAARGLDIPDVAHVIQYDLPHTPDEFDSFVHRVGRTGRAGHVGVATALFVPGADTDGNGRIAPLILRLLQETDQEIPEWFQSMAQQRMYNGGSRDVKSKRNFGNTSRFGGRGRGSGSSSSNSAYRGNSQQQYYQNVNSYKQTDYNANYDYGSEYLGDYRYDPSYGNDDRKTAQQYYDYGNDYESYNPSRSSTYPHSIPQNNSSIPQKIQSLPQQQQQYPRQNTFTSTSTTNATDNDRARSFNQQNLEKNPDSSSPDDTGPPSIKSFTQYESDSTNRTDILQKQRSNHSKTNSSYNSRGHTGENQYYQSQHVPASVQMTSAMEYYHPAAVAAAAAAPPPRPPIALGISTLPTAPLPSATYYPPASVVPLNPYHAAGYSTWQPGTQDMYSPYHYNVTPSVTSPPNHYGEPHGYPSAHGHNPHYQSPGDHQYRPGGYPPYY